MMRLAPSLLRPAGLAVAVAAISLVGVAVSAGAAQKKPVDKKAADKTEEAAKPTLVASFGDWNVFVGQAGKGRICYTLAQPKTREPASLKRDPGYAFISDRPGEGVRNEVSFIMGFDVAGGDDKAEAKADAKPGAKPNSKPNPKPETKAEAKSKSPSAAAPVALVEEESFDLLPKGGNLWVKNAARESLLIAAMRKASTMQIKAASLKGHPSTDTFSLTGFAQAMDRLQKECPGK